MASALRITTPVAPTRNLSDDLRDGLQNEVDNAHIIRRISGRGDFKKTTDPYHPMDWISRKDADGNSSLLYMEQKGSTETFANKKRIAKNAGGIGQDGMVIGYNKVKYLKDNNKNAIFFFKFLDGTRYLRYDKDLFETFPRGMFQRQSRNTATKVVDTPKMCIYIPFDLMIEA